MVTLSDLEWSFCSVNDAMTVVMVIEEPAVFTPIRCHTKLYVKPAYFQNCLQSKHRWQNKKLSYCRETVRRESMPRVAEMDVEMTS